MKPSPPAPQGGLERAGLDGVFFIGREKNEMTLITK